MTYTLFQQGDEPLGIAQGVGQMVTVLQTVQTMLAADLTLYTVIDRNGKIWPADEFLAVHTQPVEEEEE